MRRRITPAAISLAEVPRPSDIESEVLDAFDARQKLEAAIESENRKREVEEIELAKLVAREISGSQVVNVDAVFQRNVAGKAAADRTSQRREALDNILSSVNTRFEQLKCDSPMEVNAALTKRINALEQTLSERKDGVGDLEDQIKMLKAEIIKLPKTYAKKA